MTAERYLAKTIAPKLNPSYSPNLHKFVRAWEWPSQDPEVWRENKDGTLWIGRQDRKEVAGATCGFTGVRLNRVLCFGAAARKERGWYTNLGPGNMTHLADFWERYRAIGRCAIDTEHRQAYIGDEGRYILADDVRTCTWCGAQHHRRVEVKTITQEIEHFDPIPRPPVRNDAQQNF